MMLHATRHVVVCGYAFFTPILFSFFHQKSQKIINILSFENPGSGIDLQQYARTANDKLLRPRAYIIVVFEQTSRRCIH